MEPVGCVNCQSFQRRVRDLPAENEQLRRQLDMATAAAHATDPMIIGNRTVFREGATDILAKS
jgi:hypothetical protein